MWDCQHLLQITVLQNYCPQSPLRLDFASLQFQEGFTKEILVHCSATWKGFSCGVLKSNCTDSVQLQDWIILFLYLLLQRTYMSLHMQGFSVSFNAEMWFLLLWCFQTLALYSCLLCSVFLSRRKGGCGLSFIFL